MITFQRTACLLPGKTSQAVAFAHEISAYLKDAYGQALTVSVPIGGNPARIAWSASYPDMAAVEAFSAKTLADKRYQDIVAQTVDIFIPGSLEDAFWRSI